MLIDKRNEFGSAVAVTAAGGNNLGGIIDLGSARDVGNGQPLYLVVQITEDITHATTGTIYFELLTDDNTGLTSPVSLARSAQAATATSASVAARTKAGSTFWAQALPTEGFAYERYIFVQSVTNSLHATGKASAFLTTDIAAWKAYADAVN